MSNRLVEVKVVDDDVTDDRVTYSWRENNTKPWHVSSNTKRCAFRLLLNDIHKDKIPLNNISIDRNILPEFNEYVRTHRMQIEVLQNDQPSDWSNGGYGYVVSSSRYDSDDEENNLRF
jgi:hypothetical protein